MQKNHVKLYGFFFQILQIMLNTMKTSPAIVNKNKHGTYAWNYTKLNNIKLYLVTVIYFLREIERYA